MKRIFPLVAIAAAFPLVSAASGAAADAPVVNDKAGRVRPPVVRPGTTPTVPQVQNVQSISFRYACNVMVQPGNPNKDGSKAKPWLEKFTLEKQSSGKYAAIGEPSAFTQNYYSMTRNGDVIEFTVSGAREDYVKEPNEILTWWLGPLTLNTKTGIMEGTYGAYLFGYSVSGSCKTKA